MLIDVIYLALESSHAIWEAMKIAKTLPKDQDLVVVSHLSIYSMLFSHQCTSAYLDEATKTLSRFQISYRNGLISLTGMSPLTRNRVLRRRNRLSTIVNLKCRSTICIYHTCFFTSWNDRMVTSNGKGHCDSFCQYTQVSSSR